MLEVSGSELFQDLGQREPGRPCISSILTRWQRLRFVGCGDERLGEQQLRAARLPGSGLGVAASPGTVIAGWRSIHAGGER
jgi:hypothetical protein